MFVHLNFVNSGMVKTDTVNKEKLKVFDLFLINLEDILKYAIQRAQSAFVQT